ncbi:MAG: DNA alkylation repair protein [Lentisphaeria bacterium]
MNSIRARLEACADPDYRAFTRKLIPTALPILGVRTPILKKLVQELVKGDWRSALASVANDSLEEVHLKGYIIGMAGMLLAEREERIRAFLPLIDNWATCDGFCSVLKVLGRDRERCWSFLQPCFHSAAPFERRFAIVMLLNYFLHPEELPRIFQVFEEISRQEYYVQMALAWALSMVYAKFPEPTLAYLQNCTLEDDILRKTLQKIRESRQVPAALKKPPLVLPGSKR